MTDDKTLPKNWRHESLDFVFSVVDKKDRTIQVEEDNRYKLITVKLYSKGIYLRKETIGKEIKTKKMYIVHENDFIFSKIDARNGAWGFVPRHLDRAVVSSDFPILKIKNHTNKEFLEYFLSSRINWELLRNIATGTTNRKRIQPETFLRTLKIPLPPLPEQERIAFVLSSIQKDIEASEKVIQAAKEMKRSMMKHLFTYGLVSVKERDKVKVKETEIGMVPEEWEVVRLGDFFEFSRKPRGLDITKYTQIPFIPMEYILDEGIYIDRYNLKNPEDIKSGTFFFKGDLLVAKITPSFENGKQCIVKDIPTDFGYATTEVWPIHETDKSDSLFLFYYLKRPEIRTDIASKMEGSTGRQRVPKNVLENLKIPLPPLPEQKRIAEILSAVDEKIEAEERKKRALEEVFKSMLHNLMTGKLRVKSLDLKKYRLEKEGGGIDGTEAYS